MHPDVTSGMSVTADSLGIIHLRVYLFAHLPLCRGCSRLKSRDEMLWQIADVPINNLSGLMDRRGETRPRASPAWLPSPVQGALGQETHSASLEGPQTVSLASIFHDTGMQPLKGQLTCSSPRILKWWSSLIKELGQPAVGKKN